VRAHRGGLQGTRLAIRVVVNRPPESPLERAELVPFDPARRALEARIEQAKERLFADLDRVQQQLRTVAAVAALGVAKRVMRAVLLSGVVVLGIVTALVLRRQQRRIRIVWK